MQNAAISATHAISTNVLNSIATFDTPAAILYEQSVVDTLYAKYRMVFDTHEEIESITVSESPGLTLLAQVTAEEGKEIVVEHEGINYGLFDFSQKAVFDLQLVGTCIYRDGQMCEVYNDPHGATGNLELGVQANVGEPGGKQFIAAWGPSYHNPGVQHVPPSFFGDDTGYTHEDVEVINALAVGETRLFDAGSHAVTRLV